MSRHTDLDRTRRSERTPDALAAAEADDSLTEEHAAGNNLDKIRDILFGAQVRDHERRFTKLEAQLLAEAAQLRTDLKDRFAALDQYIRHEVESVTGQLKAEEQQRTDAVSHLTTELQTLAGVLQQTASQLRTQSEQAHRELQDQLHHQATTLAGDFTQRHTALSATLDEAIRQLTHQKTDRVSLATLFQELSQRLSHDQPPSQT
ncbi:MAG: hypothetical protein H8K06_02845 [Nitrospira sp.]|uniref:Cointegrate resolution protein T n=1 Tax=Nitrospira defluvii TaxID=330214 RepID=A0ABM8QNW2_9BACT|nr:hypothetical protein [Nitrospira defluvii]MCS6326016.1 hypothetical protein [Nitrospira sp.]CAE6707379.1 conserved hypothetical protein [Nitrospira defluvii]